VPWWTWLALGFFLAALVAGAVFTVFALGRLKRAAAVSGELQARLDGVAAQSEELERRLERTQARTEEIETAKARVDASLARLSVLTWALSDARSDVTRLRRTYLRK
jgi:predicted RNase H-like nuclease (RuvC/YqgF family)